MPHHNELIIRQLIIACAPDCHNPEVLKDYVDEHSAYHIPGWSILSGEYKGLDQIATLEQKRVLLLQHNEHQVKLVGTSVSNEHDHGRHS